MQPPWGLDRIDQRDGRNNTYNYLVSRGGVNVYVIDSGVRTTHGDFDGRASTAVDYINEGCSDWPERRQGGGSLVSDSFPVPAGGARWWTFTVPAGSTGRVVGDFRTAGGSGNDIEMGITDENGANGHAGRFWYHSGKVTTGTIDVQLGPGTYYLVFSNRFSVFTQKTVSADINLTIQ